MECGKLTAKLRDMVTVRFYDGENEVKRYHNIEIPEEIKHLPYNRFEFSVPLDGAISFKIWLEENPAEWPEARGRKKRAKTELMEINYEGDRKTLVAAMAAILSVQPQYLGLPSYAYQIGEYRVGKDGLLTGPADEKIREKLKEMGLLIS